MNRGFTAPTSHASRCMNDTSTSITLLGEEPLNAALRRNVWNPAPIDRCPMIACRQEDSDSWSGTAVTPWKASLGHLERRSTPGSTAQRFPRNDRIFTSPTPKVIGSAPGGGARSQQVGHPLSDGSPLIEARARIVAKLLIP